MGKHKFTDEIAQGKRQKAKNFHEKITAYIERATVLQAKNNTTVAESGHRVHVPIHVPDSLSHSFR